MTRYPDDRITEYPLQKHGYSDVNKYPRNVRAKKDFFKVWKLHSFDYIFMKIFTLTTMKDQACRTVKELYGKLRYVALTFPKKVSHDREHSFNTSCSKYREKQHKNQTFLDIFTEYANSDEQFLKHENLFIQATAPNWPKKIHETRATWKMQRLLSDFHKYAFFRAVQLPKRCKNLNENSTNTKSQQMTNLKEFKEANKRPRPNQYFDDWIRNRKCK
uniref:Uncharacterized protein n=1 Tax=Romanomermis culicivorax TaxID=13658 RepID=A0A915JHA9_ROMCU